MNIVHDIPPFKGWRN